MTMTFFPSRAYASAIFTETFVFPTPPFPLVTVMMRVFLFSPGPGADAVLALINSRSCSA